MTNLEVCLLTFILSLSYISVACTPISKSTIKNNDYITMPDGSVWKKIMKGHDEKVHN